MNKQQKLDYVTAANRHFRMDMLVQGSYAEETENYENFKGCSVGCFMADVLKANGEVDMHQVAEGPYEAAHESVAKHYGLPLWLIHAQEEFFESTNVEDKTHLLIAEAVKPVESDAEWITMKNRILVRIMREFLIITNSDVQRIVSNYIDIIEQTGEYIDISQKDMSIINNEDYALWSAIQNTICGDKEGHMLQNMISQICGFHQAKYSAVLKVFLEEIAK